MGEISSIESSSDIVCITTPWGFLGETLACMGGDPPPVDLPYIFSKLFKHNSILLNSFVSSS